MFRAIGGVALALVIATSFMAVLLTLRRIRLGRRAARSEEIERRLKPIALALLDGGPAPPSTLSPEENAVFEQMLARLGRHVTGPARGFLTGYFEQSGAVDRALGQLRGRRGWKRAAAAFLLGDMEATRAETALIAALEDPDRAVRSAAARSLGRIGSREGVGPIVEAAVSSSIPFAVGGAALLAIGPAALPNLLALIQGGDPALRGAAVTLTGFLGGAGEASAAIALLQDPSAPTRAAAADALVRIGDHRAYEPLVARLEDRIPFVRAAAARALGSLGDPSAIPRLFEIARADESEPAAAAARAIARIDPNALEGVEGEDSSLTEAADLVAIFGTVDA